MTEAQAATIRKAVSMLSETKADFGKATGYSRSPIPGWGTVEFERGWVQIALEDLLAIQADTKGAA